MNSDLQRSLELASHLECFNTDLELRAKTYQSAAAFDLGYQLTCPELAKHSVTQVTQEESLNFANRRYIASILPWSHRE